MIDLATEMEHLRVAERHIFEGEDRVARQADLVEQLRGEGHDVVRAEELLGTFRRTLRAWEGHRDGIRRTIETITILAGAPDPGAPAES